MATTLLVAAGQFIACGGSDNNNSTGTGGVAAVGGSTADGGSTHTGGSKSADGTTGGASATGGSAATGGSKPTGGRHRLVAAPPLAICHRPVALPRMVALVLLGVPTLLAARPLRLGIRRPRVPPPRAAVNLWPETHRWAALRQQAAATKVARARRYLRVLPQSVALGRPGAAADRTVARPPPAGRQVFRRICKFYSSMTLVANVSRAQ